jgi:hypothetical protein
VRLKLFLIKIDWILSDQFGINVRRFFLAFIRLPRYIVDLIIFRSKYRGHLELHPCLHDRKSEGGSAKDEYFLQDLLVARHVFRNNPIRHVDVGSRVDGFVAHVASFREIEVLDVRATTAKIPGVIFRQIDMMSSGQEFDSCDSLSCLHALEHFGLGRYSDPIDTMGSERGLAAMANMIMPAGCLYLSVPIGSPRVEFNANRVFDPMSIIEIAEKNALFLTGLTVIYRNGKVNEYIPGDSEIKEIGKLRYALGIYIFKKSTSLRSSQC